jgi:hypothetical protein
MKIEPCTPGQLSGIVWKWEWVKDFPAVLCKELLHQGAGYRIGWATIETAGDLFALKIRDQKPVKRLLDAAPSHCLGEVVQQMINKNWTFQQLVDEAADKETKEWFAKCVVRESDFSLDKMGPLAIHPRKGLKENAPDLKSSVKVTDLNPFEFYEGQHRALVLAKKLLEGGIQFTPLTAIYLYPDRAT